MKLIKNQGFPRTENPDSVILLLEVSVEKTLKAAAVTRFVMKTTQKPLYIAILFENTHLTPTVSCVIL